MPYIRYAERMEQKYLSGLYQASDFFLLPTRYDIFGMVLLEAMYYGLAVLTTHNGGSTMMIRDGENGFCLQLDAVIWARLIVRLHGDRGGRLYLGRAGAPVPGPIPPGPGRRRGWAGVRPNTRDRVKGWNGGWNVGPEKESRL